MPKEISFNLYNLKDKIVKDTLFAVGSILENEIYYIAGGLAVQFYIPEDKRRDSVDLDLTFVSKHLKKEQRFFFKEIKDFLKEEYESELKPGNNSIKLINKNNEKESFYVQVREISDKVFENVEPDLIKKCEKSNLFLVENKETLFNNYKDSKVKVLCPEDLVALKLDRVVLNEKRSGVELPIVKDYHSFYNQLLSKVEDAITRFSPYGDKHISTLRMVCDMADVQDLFKYTYKKKDEFWDKRYFAESLNSLKSFERASTRNRILTFFYSLDPPFDF